jgi:hypothetical protein
MGIAVGSPNFEDELLCLTILTAFLAHFPLSRRSCWCNAVAARAGALMMARAWDNSATAHHHHHILVTINANNLE